MQSSPTDKLLKGAPKIRIFVAQASLPASFAEAGWKPALLLATVNGNALNPPRGGGKAKENSGFRSAERCLRSLSRQIPAIQMKFSEEDMVFIGTPDRLLGA
jgi:hypothetical protein